MLLTKFGSSLTGYTPAEYGPFKCGTCKYSEDFAGEHICNNSNVQSDVDVPSDEYGNKVIESDSCCNYWTPLDA